MNRLRGAKLGWRRELEAVEERVGRNAEVTEMMAAMGRESARKQGISVYLGGGRTNENGRVVEVSALVLSLAVKLTPCSAAPPDAQALCPPLV